MVKVKAKSIKWVPCWPKRRKRGLNLKIWWKILTVWMFYLKKKTITLEKAKNALF